MLIHKRKENTMDLIKNRALVELELCEQTVEIASEPVETTPISLKVTKTQDCDFVFIGERIKYTVIIENECGGELHNLKFKDELDECLEFVEGSFRVGDEPATPEIVDGVLEYMIAELPSCETLAITFEVVVTEACCRGCRPDPEHSETPTVRAMYAYSPSMGGTGVYGATIYVERPSGAVVHTTVLAGGSWNLTLSAPYPSAGQVYKVWQVEPGKSPSKIVSVTVGA